MYSLPFPVRNVATIALAFGFIVTFMEKAQVLHAAPVLDLTGYSVIFFEDFDTLSLRTGGPTRAGYASGSGIWTPRYYWSKNPKGDTHDKEYAWLVDPAYTWGDGYPASGQFSVSNSILTIRAESTPTSLIGKIPDRTAGNPYPWVSGILSTANSFSFKAPIYAEARIKVPKGTALWPAFWMWAVNRNFNNEIDVVEIVNTTTNKSSAAIHWQNPIQDADTGPIDRGVDLSLAYHTYGVQWTATDFNFYIDGYLIWTHSVPVDWEETYMFMYLGFAVGGPLPGVPPDKTTPDPSDLLVDWVRVWGTAATPYLNTP